MVETGDLNTRYFHSIIKWRRAKTSISRVKNEGQWYDEEGVVKKKN